MAFSAGVAFMAAFAKAFPPPQQSWSIAAFLLAIAVACGWLSAQLGKARHDR
jgi:hypothetical protein